MEIFIQVLAGAVIGMLVVAAVIGGITKLYSRLSRTRTPRVLLMRHFQAKLDDVAISERQFPFHIRPDVQRAVEAYLAGVTVKSFLGVRAASRFEGLEFTGLFDEQTCQTVSIGPPQYEAIDVGGDEPVQGLQNGLWLVESDGLRMAVLQLSSLEIGSCGFEPRLKLQVAVRGSEQGAAAASAFFDAVESAVKRAQSYRGKVLSLEQSTSYSGQSGGVKVHRLGSLTRDDVILPPGTLELLDRNVLGFVANRAALGRFEMSTKKGLLFYGPPGTGKTHTIRYLAGSLPDHTTFLIAAEQVGQLSEYMTLARLLQPSLVVVEDVDLIARQRTEQHNAATESLLNKLLNEMDGLTEQSDILFILTTNRPEDLEAALASRPGRIDQAIEFPLPDEIGRGKLIRLYARGIIVSDELVAEIVRRTRGVSAVFIKELMRRSAQFHLTNNGTDILALADVERALNEMIFAGGALNMKLLGAEAWSDDEP